MAALRGQTVAAGDVQVLHDPELEAKVSDVVGLYLNPRTNAVVLCVDEKSQIQALNRTQPILLVRLGLPEQATHDYQRNGTTTLFAALQIATGTVTDRCYERHGKAEFLGFSRSWPGPTRVAACTWSATTTTRTNTPTSTLGWPKTRA